MSINLLHSKTAAVTKYTQKVFNLWVVLTLTVCTSGLYDIKFQTCDETLKDKKQHYAVNKSTSKQQVCISDGIRLHCAKNWTNTPSANGSYGKPAGRQKKALLFKKI